jgi:HlyD family secretion protein
VAFATQQLKSLQEVRPADIDVLESEVRAAAAEEGRLKAELAATAVRAPVTGQVIRIDARTGENASGGLLELVPDGPLYAVAEVDETDIARVRPGERASVQGKTSPFAAQGEVESIDRRVGKSQIVSPDPNAFTDLRVVPVKIRLAGVNVSDALLNSKVEVRIFQ